MIFVLDIAIMVSFLTCIAFLIYFAYLTHKHQAWIKAIFQTSGFGIFSTTTNKADLFKLKLTQAGITKKEYNQIVYLAVAAGVSIFLLITPP